MTNQMMYTTKQVDLQEKLKAEIKANNWNNWELIEGAWGVEDGRVIVSGEKRFTIKTVYPLNKVTLINPDDGKEFDMDKKKLMYNVLIGKLVVEYR